MKMNKLIACTVVALALLPAVAGATTYPITATSATTAGGYFKKLPDNATSLAPGYEITLPALAQNDSVVVYLPFAPAGMYHLGWDDDGSVPTGGYFCSIDLSAAADSVAVVIGLGQRVGGPFNSPFSAALQAAVRTLATPQYAILTGTVALWTPAQLCRVIMKSKGATAIEVGRKAYIRFPRESVSHGR